MESVEDCKKRAKRDIVRRTIEIARLMNVVPTAVKITNATTRWGSCNAKRAVNFSWRLVLADSGCIDYVIVHELAHIKELNHSPRFWAIVANYCPDYKACKERLKILAEKLMSEQILM